MSGSAGATGWLDARRQVVRAGLLAIRDWRASLQAVEQFWRMARDGGMLICTPSVESPLIATLIQPDGDIMISVSRKLLGPDREPGRDALALLHRERVNAVMMPLQRLAQNGRSLEALLLLSRRYALRGAFLATPVPSGALLLGHGTWATLPILTGIPFVAPALAAVLRPAVMWIIRHRIAALLK